MNYDEFRVRKTTGLVDMVMRSGKPFMSLAELRFAAVTGSNDQRLAAIEILDAIKAGFIKEE